MVENEEVRRKLAEAALGQNFVAEAPLVLIFFARPAQSAKKYGERGRMLYALQDATLAASFAWLQAVMLGISACWVGAFDEAAIKKILEAQEDWRPIALLPLGYSYFAPADN